MSQRNTSEALETRGPGQVQARVSNSDLEKHWDRKSIATKVYKANDTFLSL